MEYNPLSSVVTRVTLGVGAPMISTITAAPLTPTPLWSLTWPTTTAFALCASPAADCAQRTFVPARMQAHIVTVAIKGFIQLLHKDI
jgi:hypothetical protein